LEVLKVKLGSLLLKTPNAVITEINFSLEYQFSKSVFTKRKNQLFCGNLFWAIVAVNTTK